MLELKKKKKERANPAKLYAIAIEKVCLANGMIRPPLHHMSIGNVKNINFFRLKFLR
jgi:hypothetical protein